MSFVRNFSILYIIGITIIFFVSFFRFDAYIARNLAMILYLDERNIDSNLNVLQRTSAIIPLLTYDSLINANYTFGRARLVGILRTVGNESNLDISDSLYSRLEKNFNSNCLGTEQTFLQLVALPPNQTNNLRLRFARNFGLWSIHFHDQAHGSLIYTPDIIKPSECIAKITANFTFKPHRFISFQQEVQVFPLRQYNLTAVVRTNEVDKAWMGISSKWAGISIANTSDWQKISYNFSSNTTKVETVQFIIESGNGELEIRNVTLELIK